MRSIIWGLTLGLLAATAVGLGPVVLVGILSGSVHEFEELGGVGRYLTWAYTSGALGGLTAGILRPVVRSGLALRLTCGLVLGEVFALQPLIFDMGEIEPGPGYVARLMGTAAFVLGFVLGPLMITGLRQSWGDRLLDWGVPADEVEVEAGE